MATKTLYLSEPGYEVRRAGRLLRLLRGNVCVDRIDPSLLGHVLLFDEVILQPGAICLLLKHAVPVSFLNKRGVCLGRLLPPDPPTPSLRTAQYACAEDRGYCLRFAHTLLQGKLAAAQGLIRRGTRNNPTAPIEGPLQTLEELQDLLRGASTLSRLRGLEGRAAAVYFDAYAQLLRPPSPFHKRTRRPPRDPVNALLSFGYSLLSSEITGQIAAVGLDPQVGFLHTRRAGSPALTSDLVEEFRVPVVDRLVMRCWNLGILNEEDFEKPLPWLTTEGRRRFLQEYEQLMTKPFRHVKGFWTTYRRLLHGQSRVVAACLRHREPYERLPVRL